MHEKQGHPRSKHLKRTTSSATTNHPDAGDATQGTRDARKESCLSWLVSARHGRSLSSFALLRTCYPSYLAFSHCLSTLSHLRSPTRTRMYASSLRSKGTQARGKPQWWRYGAGNTPKRRFNERDSGTNVDGVAARYASVRVQCAL